REEFLRRAVANRCNPVGRSLDTYPVLHRGLIADLTNMAGGIDAAIEVVSYSDDSITIDTGPYYAGAIGKEMTARAEQDNTLLILRTNHLNV
ncbi:MAG TPA: hypothetical protein VFP21_10090, partial [Solirubrobacterales bacterium]|nr:hypothetical protein [Solirubrobacterales bacterium]